MPASPIVQRARAGFTLIEVLVGMTVAAIALSAGFATLAVVQDRSEYLEAVDLVATSGATQRQMIVDWLVGVRLVALGTSEPFMLEDDEANGMPMDELLLPTTAPSTVEGPTTVVGLYVDLDPETVEQGLVAEITGIRLGEDPRLFEIAPQAGGMNVRLLPQGATEWIDGMDWDDDNGFPRAVEITLLPMRGDSLPTLLRYPIRVAIGAVR